MVVHNCCCRHCWLCWSFKEDGGQSDCHLNKFDTQYKHWSEPNEQKTRWQIYKKCSISTERKFELTAYCIVVKWKVNKNRKKEPIHFICEFTCQTVYTHLFQIDINWWTFENMRNLSAEKRNTTKRYNSTNDQHLYHAFILFIFFVSISISGDTRMHYVQQNPYDEWDSASA